MKTECIAAFSAAVLMTAGSAMAADIERSVFGTLDDGTEIEMVTLIAKNGVTAKVMTLGAALQSIWVPDRDGKLDDITLGFDDPQSYLDFPSYFGATVGRYANRIGDATFSLNGETYELDVNEADNQLHGGPLGFDKRVWTIAEAEDGDVAKVVLTYESPDGEMGYPGNMSVRVTYSLSNNGELTILHEATTDKTTVANITNHSYFNLAGQSSHYGILDHELKLAANAYTPVDGELIPTGEVRDVAGTVFDFQKGKPIRHDIHDGSEPQLMGGRGYDHNWVLTEGGDALRMAAKLSDPHSGRVMEMWSNQPAIQFYSGNFLDGSLIGKGGRIYRQADGLCLEPQNYPDAPNKADFPSAVLQPGETYRNEIVLRFSTTKRKR